MSMPPPDPKVIDVSIVEVKPKYFFEEVMVVQAKHAMIQKYGAKPLGHFFSQGGEFGEIIHIVEWASMAARKQGMQTMMKDPEFHAMHKATGKHVKGGRSYICKESPFFKLQALKPGASIFMENLCFKKFPILCMKKFGEVHECVAKKLGAAAPAILGVLHPTLGPGHGVIIFVDIPNSNPDEFFNNWLSVMTSPDMWPKLAEGTECMSPCERRVLIPLSEIPKP